VLGSTEKLITEPYGRLSENKINNKNIVALYLRIIFMMKTGAISTKQVDLSSYQWWDQERRETMSSFEA
jgi:uncharacterized membrane protein affecting hemolysin expression